MTEALLWLMVVLPGAAAILVRFAPRAHAAIAVAGACAAAAGSVVLLAQAAGGERIRSTVAWIPGGGLDAGLRLDGLSAATSVTVAVAGLVVIVYSTGYFASDPRRPTALAGLLAFLAAMQGLVLADGFLALLFFWEIVGAASARLIAYGRGDAAAAGAVRAFLTTRTADLGLYLAIIALFSATGSVAFASVRPDGALGAIVGLGLVVAAMGKSAQAPLQTWLAGAMAGPTPVSALLHSATMVAAGVYLLARSADLLAGWPLAVAGWVGALTAVGGAAIALAQRDLKRVLAGSTTSQLGLMFVGVAAGGPAVGVFHLIAHAAGKAGLFLATGIFQHARHTTDLEGLRGAGREDRTAFALFAVCAGSIAAVPPLAAFWSKDHIAAAAEETRLAWFALVLLAAAGSAAYLLRPALVLLDGPAARPVASPGRRPMLAACGVAAAASVVLGAAGGPLSRLLGAEALPTSTLSLVLALAATAAGAAAVLAGVRAPAALARAAGRQFYAEELLRGAAQRPVLAAAAGADVVERRVVDRAVDGAGRAGLALARSQDVFERRVLDRAVDGTGRAGLALARSQDAFERHGIDAAVDGTARAVGRGGDRLRRVQSGRLYEYLRDASLGAAALAFLITLTTLT